MVVCDIADVFYAEMYGYFMRNTIILNVITVLIYAVVWISIRKNIKCIYFVN